MGARARGRRAHAFGYLGSRTANDPQKEEGRRCVIALDAAAMRIHPSQVVLRHHVAQACAVAIQGRSQNLVAYNAFAMLVSNRPKAQAHTC